MNDKTQTAVIAAPQAAAPVLETNAIISMIERVARDPNANIEKVREMLLLRRQEQDYDAKRSYAAALSAMQLELPVIKERGEVRHDKNKPPQFTYARWEDINEAIKPVLAKHGFALSFRTGREADKIVVTGILSHRDGHSEETVMHLPIDTGPGRNAVQSVGSSTSYGKRYAASALLNLTSRGDDDDGAAAGAGDTIAQDQIADIQAMIDDIGGDKAEALKKGFLKKFKIDALADLPVSQWKDAVAALQAKRAA